MANYKTHINFSGIIALVVSLFFYSIDLITLDNAIIAFLLGIIVYGLMSNIYTSNPISINFYEWKEMSRDMGKTKGFKNKWHYMVKPPGWRA